MDKLRLLIKTQGSFGASVTEDQELAQEHRVAFVEEKNTKSEEVKMGDKLSKQKTKQQKESDMRQAMASNTAPSNQLLHGRGKVNLYFIANLIKK